MFLTLESVTRLNAELEIATPPVFIQKRQWFEESSINNKYNEMSKYT